MIRSCQVIANINRNVGGPAITVPRLAQALTEFGVESSLLTLDYPEHGPQTEAPGVRVHSLPAGAITRRWRGWSPAMRDRLQAIADNGVDVIHSHGLWMFPNVYARQVANRNWAPLVISPRGMVEAWSLRRGRAKKFLAWHLYERENLRSAALFHATSEEEAASLRAIGLRQPIAVIPNGIDLPDLTAIPPRTLLESRFPELREKSWLLFMSRLHVKKGIDRLLRVWGDLEARFASWQLVVAGPDLDGYGGIAREQCAALGIQSRVTFPGMLAGTEKICALGNAGLSVLPSHSENFGIVVAESLAWQRPVVTTRGTPWRDLETHECGWWVENEDEALGRALTDALAMNEETRLAMGHRGRRWMEESYSWDSIGERMRDVYRWCCGRAERPDVIRTV